MKMPYPEVVAPVVLFQPADAFHGDHLYVWEEEDFGPLDYPSEPYFLIGYDGKGFRILDGWGPPEAPETAFGKVVSWIAGIKDSPSLQTREVTPFKFSLDEFKREVCRRIPGNPSGVFSAETLAGEDLPPPVDIEAISAQLVEKACANVRAASSIPDVIDALLAAQSAGYRWAEVFARA